MKKKYMSHIVSGFIGSIIGGLITFQADLYLLNKQMKDTHKYNVVNEYFSLTDQKKLEYRLIRQDIDVKKYKLQTFLEIEKSFGKLSMLIKDDELLNEIRKKHLALLLSYSRFLELLKKSNVKEINNASLEYHLKQEELKQFIIDKLF